MNRYRQPTLITQIKCQEPTHENNTIQFICLQESCKSRRFYCSKCALKHSSEHGSFLVSLEDIISNKDPSQIENYPAFAEERKVKKCLTQQALISQQTSTIHEIIQNLMGSLKQDILFQIDEIQKELESFFKKEQFNTQKSISEFQYTQSQTFSIDELRDYIEQYVKDNDDYKFNTRLLIWLTQSQKNQQDIRQSSQKNLNQEMIPSIIQQHHEFINLEIKKMRDNLVSYIRRDSVLPAHLVWGFKKSKFENSQNLIEKMIGVTFEGCGNGDQSLLSTNTFEFGRHEFEIQFDKIGFQPQCHLIIGLVKDQEGQKIFDQANPYSCIFCDRTSCQMRKINSIERKFVMEYNSNQPQQNNNNIIKVVLDFDKDTFYFTDEKNMMTSLWTSIKGQRWRFQVTFKTEFAFSGPSPCHQITLLSSS
ncbi:hypothetical protein TTHERM_00463430 (macronuclear) [Tetrahymena thermophila SB210]|uniref:Uncharacterized protein n=1 Tax=Tetrahymena thermophila (strain SB210) TaxID=312017 RepID=Q23PU0_TETTS|nr:hypothetical protein TTHERM_00463430 [Tetrahymena thermophila SB210]EAR98595.4 hypothetical protein TTHERM_00463430 [Tetrahymena thermophila SB210]|eukprot:XP_001018840.4 hypothetical protein TTHERM_00463430 [Tetrahymena thermophila SB210]